MKKYIATALALIMLGIWSAPVSAIPCLDEDLYYPPGSTEPICDDDSSPIPPGPITETPSTSSNIKLTYFTSDGSTTIDMPVILVAGYDPANEYTAYDYYDGPEGLPADFKQWLKTTGRDLVVMTFNNYTQSLKVLSNDFRAGLAEVNNKKSGSHPTAVIGFSAGGLISRWALKTMENEGLNHDVSVYISYDSPHRGALIPESIIDGIKDLKDKVPNDIFKVAMFFNGPLRLLSNFDPEPQSLKDTWIALNSTAARELLIGRGSNFLREIDALGYPENLARYAVANGSGTGKLQNLPKNAIVFDYKAKIAEVSNEYQTIKQAAQIPCTYPCDPLRNRDYDRSPGSIGDTYEVYWNQIEDADSLLFDVNVYYKNTNLKYHSFVNTLSALDIKNYDINSTLNSELLNYGPFDDYAYGTENQPHTFFQFTNKLQQWLTSNHSPNWAIPNERANRIKPVGDVGTAQSNWLYGGTNLLFWGAVDNATYYEVLQLGASGYTRAFTTTKNSKRITVNKNTSYMVRACNADHCSYPERLFAQYKTGTLLY